MIPILRSANNTHDVPPLSASVVHGRGASKLCYLNNRHDGELVETGGRIMRDRKLKSSSTKSCARHSSFSVCSWLILLVALLLGVSGCNILEKSRVSEKPEDFYSKDNRVNLATETVQKRRLSDSLQVPGEIHPEFGKEVLLTNRIRGRVVKIFVSPGRKVEKGQTLALVDSKQVSDLQSELIESRSQLDIARAHEERERQIYQEQLKRPEALLEADADLEQSKVDLELAERNLKRYKQLLDEGIVASKDFYTAQASDLKAQSVYRQAKADLERERRLYKNRAMMKRDLQLAQAEVRRAQQHLNTLRQRLIFLGMTAARVDQILATGKIVGTIPIIAPMAGIISKQEVALGEMVDPGKVAFKITDLTTVALTADVPDVHLPKLAVGMPVKARINGYPDLVFAGKINYISTYIDPDTRTAPIRARLVNTDLKLRANVFADAEIILPPSTVLACPKESVQKKGGRQVVYVADDHGYREQPIQIGRTDEKFYEVKAGLSEGDRVVTTGSLLLKTEIESGNRRSAVSDLGEITR